MSGEDLGIRSGRWCILRTTPGRTLRLAGSLAEDGYAVWTPIETRIERVPRVNVKAEVRRPILAGFVFADADRLVDLLQLAAMPVKPRRGGGCRLPAHVAFSVMRHAGQIPVIDDAQMAPLRRLEDRRTRRKPAAYAFPSGVRVRAGEGHKSVAGMSGVVIRSDRGSTTVDFGGLFGCTTIPTSLLSADSLSAA